MKKMLSQTVRSVRQIVVGSLICAMLVPAAFANEPINFLLDFVPYGKHAFFYAALEKGFWKDAGFDVTILKGSGSAATVAAVAADSAEFGFADIPTAIIGISKGANVQIVGVIHEKSLYSIGWLDDVVKIKGPRDLEGKRIASSAGDASRVLFPALAQIVGLDQSKVTWVTMTAPARAASLIAGQADATVLLATETPTFSARARESGKKWASFLYSDYGLDLYGGGLIVPNDQIAKDPERTKKFVQATYKAVAWSVEHPEEALQTFLKDNPAVNPVEAREHWRIALAHLMTANTKRFGIGYMDKDKMQHTVDTVEKYFNATGLQSDNIYTNRFLIPKIVPTEGHLN
jgi:NitT/TauT family transport system substrate-binding protein